MIKVILFVSLVLSNLSTIPNSSTRYRPGEFEFRQVAIAAYWTEFDSAPSRAELDALAELVWRESRFDHRAQNSRSTAYGWFQFLNSTWKSTGLSKTSDKTVQTRAGLRYIKTRYGNAQFALSRHKTRGHY